MTWLPWNNNHYIFQNIMNKAMEDFHFFGPSNCCKKKNKTLRKALTYIFTGGTSSTTFTSAKRFVRYTSSRIWDCHMLAKIGLYYYPHSHLLKGCLKCSNEGWQFSRKIKLSHNYSYLVQNNVALRLVIITPLPSSLIVDFSNETDILITYLIVSITKSLNVIGC